MRKFSIAWFLMAVCVLPFCMDINRLGCCLFIVINLLLSFLMMRRYARDWFNN